MHFVRACCVRGAHPEGTGPPSLACRACGPSGWFGAPPVGCGPSWPPVGWWGQAGPPFKKGPGAAGSPCGAVPALGRKRPAPWLAAGGPCGAGGACGHGPHRQSSTPLLPCWEPHCSTASRVCARRSRPATHPAGGHIRKPPASSPAAALRRAVPLFCVGPALDCAVLLRHCPTGQKGV